MKIFTEYELMGLLEEKFKDIGFVEYLIRKYINPEKGIDRTFILKYKFEAMNELIKYFSLKMYSYGDTWCDKEMR